MTQSTALPALCVRIPVLRVTSSLPLLRFYGGFSPKALWEQYFGTLRFRECQGDIRQHAGRVIDTQLGSCDSIIEP